MVHIHGGCNAFVSHNLLNDLQIYLAFTEAGTKRMPQVNSSRLQASQQREGASAGIWGFRNILNKRGLLGFCQRMLFGLLPAAALFYVGHDSICLYPTSFTRLQPLQRCGKSVFLMSCILCNHLVFKCRPYHRAIRSGNSGLLPLFLIRRLIAERRDRLLLQRSLCIIITR